MWIAGSNAMKFIMDSNKVKNRLSEFWILS